MAARRLFLGPPSHPGASGRPRPSAVAMATEACSGLAGLEEALRRAVPPLPPYETREKAAAPAGAALEQGGAEFMRFYRGLEPGRARAQLLSRLARDFGVEHGRVAELSGRVVRLQQERGGGGGGEGDDEAGGGLLQAEDRLRHSLTPRYRGLFQHLGRQEGGLRFLVELRRDLLEALAARQAEGPHLRVSPAGREGGREEASGQPTGSGVLGGGFMKQEVASEERLSLFNGPYSQESFPPPLNGGAF